GYLNDNPTVLTAYLGADSGAQLAWGNGQSSGLQAYLATDPATLSAFLNQFPGAQQAWGNGGAPGLQSYLTNPANSAVLNAYLASAPPASPAYNGGLPTGDQNPDLAAYLATDPPGLTAFLATFGGAAQAWGNGGGTGLQAYLLANLSALQSFIGGNPAS